MAVGQPPHSELHPMRALFVIPRSVPPPALEGPFSAAFKAFVAACLQKDPAARPTATALLVHPFLAASPEPGANFRSRIAAHAAAPVPASFAEVRSSSALCELIGEPIKRSAKLTGEPIKGRVKTGT